MITVLKWRPPDRAAALMAAAMVAVGLGAALAHSSALPAHYGVAEHGVINADTDGLIHGFGVVAQDGVINADGVGGTGHAPARGGAAISPDSNGVINAD